MIFISNTKLNGEEFCTLELPVVYTNDHATSFMNLMYVSLIESNGSYFKMAVLIGPFLYGNIYPWEY